MFGGRCGLFLLLELRFLLAEQRRAFLLDLLGRHGVAVGVGEREGDDVGFLRYEAEHDEFMRGGVVLATVGGGGEVRVAFHMDGVGDVGGTVGGEVHVQRGGVRAVGVDLGERIINVAADFSRCSASLLSADC